jgi:Double zinc ribbon
MKCPSCGCENRDGAKFFGDCATLLAEALVCPRCGTANPKGRKFCDSCGEADAWLEMSGAKSYEPFVHVARAGLARLTGDEAARERELREAHRLFLEISAPIRAAEVAKSSGCELRPLRRVQPP